jgi:hypothetical protein
MARLATLVAVFKLIGKPFASSDSRLFLDRLCPFCRSQNTKSTNWSPPSAFVMTRCLRMEAMFDHGAKYDIHGYAPSAVLIHCLLPFPEPVLALDFSDDSELA